MRSSESIPTLNFYYQERRDMASLLRELFKISSSVKLVAPNYGYKDLKITVPLNDIKWWHTGERNLTLQSIKRIVWKTAPQIFKEDSWYRVKSINVVHELIRVKRCKIQYKCKIVITLKIEDERISHYLFLGKTLSGNGIMWKGTALQKLFNF